MITMRSAMLDITEYKMVNGEGWSDRTQQIPEVTESRQLSFMYLFICLFIMIQKQEAGPDTHDQS